MPPQRSQPHAPLYRRKVIGSAQKIERLAERLVSDEALVRGGVPRSESRSCVIVQPSTTVESAARRDSLTT